MPDTFQLQYWFNPIFEQWELTTEICRAIHSGEFIPPVAWCIAEVEGEEHLIKWSQSNWTFIGKNLTPVRFEAADPFTVTPTDKTTLHEFTRGEA